jgi:hypothetical protein
MALSGEYPLQHAASQLEIRSSSSNTFSFFIRLKFVLQEDRKKLTAEIST